MRLSTILFYAFLSTFIVRSPLHADSGTYPEVKVLIDIDQSFVQKAGDSTKAIAFVQKLLAKVDATFRAQAGLSVSSAGIHVWDSADSFDRSSMSILLASFASYAEANYRGTYTYDVGYLIVGDGLGGEGGIAYEGSACGAGSSSQLAYALSQPDLTDEDEFNPHLFCHELGHTLNAEHDAWPGCKVKNIMCPGQIGGKFSTESVSAMAAYVSARNSDAGCFPSTFKTDPTTTVKIKLTVSGSRVSYRVTGAEGCTSLTLVGSPSIIGLKTMFGYLQIGELTPAATIDSYSKGAYSFLGSRSSKLYVGAYCDGQLVSSKPSLPLSKIRGRRATTSIVTLLRKLKSGFRVQ